jgi:hypothetical protein
VVASKTVRVKKAVRVSSEGEGKAGIAVRVRAE